VRFFTINNSLDNQLEFEINYCGYATHDAHWLEERNKPTYAIWIVSKGSVCISYSDRDYFLKEGDVFFFRPNVPYKAWTESKSGCRFMFILFDVYIGRSHTSTDVLQTEGMMKGEIISTEREVVFACFESYTKGDHLSLLHLKSAAIFLITKMLSEAKPGSVTLSADIREKTIKLKTILSYIDDNLHNDITVKELADTLYMSEKYFITYFKKIIGTTPFSYITSIKMKKAYELIGAEGYSIKRTAELLGYSDQYVFSKAFKRMYGFAPSRVLKDTELK